MQEKIFQPGDEHKPALNPDVPELPPPSLGAEDDPGPCPITILGSDDGLYSFLTPRGERRVIAAREFSKTTIRGLFGARIDWLWKRWPVRDRDNNIKSWNADAANEYLIRESDKMPKFNSEGAFRGPGTWFVEGDREIADHVIVHSGHALYVNLPEDQGGGWRGVGKYRKYIYALGVPQPPPTEKESTTKEAENLLTLLRTWNWQRPEVDPRLLLGWIVVATICGALRWRPSVWLTGDKKTGKSTLQILIGNILGNMLLRSAEPTGAFIRQRLAGAARPVELDEFEPESVDWKQQEILKIIRLGSTRGGAGVGRGSASGQATDYNIDATFFLSSILRSSLSGQNSSRITTLELNPLNVTVAEKARVQTAIRGFLGFGGKIHRRVLNRWDEFRNNVDMIATALMDKGHDDRAAEQLATLLGAADILVSESEMDSDSCFEIAKHFDPIKMAAMGSDETEASQCLAYLLTAPMPDLMDGKRYTVLEMMRKIKHDPTNKVLRSRLAAVGVRFGVFTLKDSVSEWCLCVAINKSQGLADIFERSHWKTKDGQTGPWAEALSRLPGLKELELEEKTKAQRFNGMSTRTVMIPLTLLDLDLDADEDAERADLPPPAPDDMALR